MRLTEWLHQLPTQPTVSQAADHAHVSKATLLRHAKKQQTTAEYAIAIARAYNVNEVQALIDLGFITLDAAKDLTLNLTLHEATNKQILDEILRRSDPESRKLFTANGREDIIDISDELP